MYVDGGGGASNSAAQLKVVHQSLLDASRQISAIAELLNSGTPLANSACGGTATTVSTALDECAQAWTTGIAVLVEEQQSNATNLQSTATTYQESDDRIAAAISQAIPAVGKTS